MKRYEIVANHKSALKRIRQTPKRTARNSYWRSTLRTSIKGVHKAIDARDVDDAQVRLQKAISVINHVASKGVIPKKQASRRVSRLTLAVNKLRAEA